MKDNNCIRVYADPRQIENCKNKLNKADDSMELLVNAMNMAGSNARLKILYLLWDQQKLCVCDLSDILGISVPGVSQHLRKLTDAGIINKDKVAQTIFHRLTPNYLKLFEPFFKMMAKNEVFEQAAV